MSRVAVLLALGLLAPTLAVCSADGPEDPAVATPGAGIPMGAIGATGVSFDAPGTRPDAPAVKGKGKPRGTRPAPLPTEPLPSTPDPFAEPPVPEGPAHGPPLQGAPHHSHSSSKETTL